MDCLLTGRQSLPIHRLSLTDENRATFPTTLQTRIMILMSTESWGHYKPDMCSRLQESGACGAWPRAWRRLYVDSVVLHISSCQRHKKSRTTPNKVNGGAVQMTSNTPSLEELHLSRPRPGTQTGDTECSRPSIRSAVRSPLRI